MAECQEEEEMNGEGGDAVGDDLEADESPVSPAEELYEIETEDVEEFNPKPIDGRTPWDSLPSSGFALLDDLTLNVGDTIFVCVTGREDGLAKVSEIKGLSDGRWLLVLFWYYTRREIEEELKVGCKIPGYHRDHLERLWPSNAQYTYMLSNNRTITMWDTAQRKATPEVMQMISTDSVYITTNSIRRIYEKSELDSRWMKDILDLRPSGC